MLGQGSGRAGYAARVSASFVELTFDSGFVVPCVFTTEVVVTPDVYPFGEPTK